MAFPFFFLIMPLNYGTHCWTLFELRTLMTLEMHTDVWFTILHSYKNSCLPINGKMQHVLTSGNQTSGKLEATHNNETTSGNAATDDNWLGVHNDNGAADAIK